MTALPITIMLLVMLPILGGLAGIVLFVVGLVKKKPAMWGSGIGLAVLSALILVVGAGAAFYLGLRTAAKPMGRAAAQAAAMRQAAAQATDEMERAVAAATDSRAFKTCTGLELPEGTLVWGSTEVTGPPPASQTYCYLRLQVSPAFRALLREHFQEANWEDVRETLTSEPTASVDLWTPADLRSKTYYTRTYRAGGAPYRTVTTIIHDPNVGVAYFIGAPERGE